MKRQWKRTLSIVLSFAMLFSTTGMNTVLALEGGPPIGASGLCEHHTEHTDGCGFTEGTPEVPCAHEHTDECYKEVADCIHTHTDECYGDEVPTATDSGAAEPVNCAHICDEACGCVTKVLGCQHGHDEDCGYIAAVPGTPCAFVCEECVKDSGQTDPEPTPCTLTEGCTLEDGHEGGCAPPPAGDGAVIQTITGFPGFDPAGWEPLDTIEVRSKTTVAAIGLPETLAVTFEGQADETSIPVTWACADDYEATEYETYDFTPVWDGEVYALAEGLDTGVLPYITVNITGAKNPLTKAATGTLSINNASVGDLAGNLNGTGWTWTAETATLELTGDYEGGYIYIDCYTSDEINLTYSGNVAVTSNTSSKNAINCKGNLTIDGSGTLTVTATPNYTNGLYARNVTFNGGELIAVGGETGIVTNSALLTINGGTVTAKGSSAGYGFYNAVINGGTVTTGDPGGANGNVFNSLTVSGDAVVTVNGDVRNNANNAVLDVSGGTVTITGSVIGTTSHTGGTLQVLQQTPDTDRPIISDYGLYERNSDTLATIKFTANEEGDLYYLVKNSGAAYPTLDDIKAGTKIESGVKAVTDAQDAEVTLTAGAKDVYIAMVDVAGNTCTAAGKIEVDALKAAEVLSIATTSIPGNAWTPGKGNLAEPHSVSVNVPNSVSSISASDITVSDGANVAVYTDSQFSSAGTVSLTAGEAKTAYIKVTNGQTAIYYTVTVNGQAFTPTAVTTADQLKAELEKTTAQTINVTADISLTDLGLIAVGESHTVNIASGKTVTIDGSTNINVGVHTLTIEGAGKDSSTLVCDRDSGFAIYGVASSTLALNDITVNVVGGNGISTKNAHIDSGARLVLNAPDRDNLVRVEVDFDVYGEVDIQDFDDCAISIQSGALTIKDGGKVTVGKGSGQNQGIHVYGGRALIVEEGGTLTSGAGGGIYLSSSSKVTGVASKFIDRGNTLSETGQVTVAASTESASTSGLTAGTYLWNGNAFEKYDITGIEISSDKQTTVFSVDKGDTLQLSATVKNVSGAEVDEALRDVEWGISSAHTSGTTISDAGLLMVAADETALALSITACSVKNPAVISRVDVGVIGGGTGTVIGSMSIGNITVKNLTYDMSGTGWEWTASTATLSLTSNYAGYAIGIRCRDSDNVNLVYTGDVSVTSSDGTALLCTGVLNITGSSGTLTANGKGTGYAVKAPVLNINGGAVKLTQADASENLYSGILNHIGGTLNGNPAPTAVTTAAQLKTELEKTTAQTISVTADISLTDLGLIVVGESHTVNIASGKTVTISGNSNINTSGRTLAINGGGTVSVQKSNQQHGINGGGTLNLESVTVNLSNATYGGLGNLNINVNSGATINVNSRTANSQIGVSDGETLTINNGGKVSLNGLTDAGINNGGTVHINGGELFIDAGQVDNIGIINNGLLKYTSGTLSAASGGGIYLTEEAEVDGMGGKFKDRGTAFTAAGQVTVGAADAAVSQTGLSDGLYVWDGSFFAKADDGSDPGDSTAPVLSNGSVYERSSDTLAMIALTSSEDGDIYYLVKNTGDTEPTKEQVVITGTEYDYGMFSGENYIEVALTAGAKDVYFVGVDEAGNISEPLKVSVDALQPAVVLSIGGVSIASGDWTGGTGHIGVPHMASISVPNSVSSISASDITVSGGASVTNVMGDFTSPPGTPDLDTIPLTVGAPTMVIIAVKNGQTVVWYEVDVTRQSAGAMPTVTSVTVSPLTVSVQKGSSQQFAATVTGENDPATTVTWSVSGGIAGTSISASGLLTVAAGETADRLTVTATSTVDTNVSGTATVTVTNDAPDPVYEISLDTGGTHTFPAATEGYGPQPNKAVTITNMGNTATGALAIALSGDTGAFDLSTETITDIAVGNSDSFIVTPKTGLDPDTYTATVTVSGTNVTAQTFDVSFTVNATQAATYTVTFNPNGGTVSETTRTISQSAAIGTLPTPTRSGSYRFDGWYTAASGGTQISAATVPTGNVTYYAHWTYTGGSYNPGGGGGGGGSSSGGGSTATVTPADPDKPNTATNAETKVTPTVGAGGSATVTVPEKSVTAAIQVAQDAAKKAGTEKNGVSVTIDATTAGSASDITATLTEKSVDDLINAGVTEVRIKGDAVTVTLNLAALKAAQAVAGGAITVSAKPVAVNTLSATAQKVIGNRPVFRFTLTSGSKAVTDFGGGSASLSIPYTPQKGEDTGKLCMVYVDDKDGVTYLTDSSYDPNTKAMIARTGHFSVYGVGYKSDAPRFTDTANHWAKDDIDFVAARGLLSGIGNSQFSPDTSMTRGMFMTALYRLAGSPQAAGEGGAFTDVPANVYYANAVKWAAQKGIVNGTTDTTFAPDRAVTRQEMAVIMANYARVMGYAVPKAREAVAFADNASIASWAKDAVKAMQMAGIINGKDGNRFDPTGTATRAEVAAVLHRYVELVIDPATAQGWTQNDVGQWMYYENGKPATGWKLVGGKWYYLYADGSMAVNTEIDDYEVGSDGVWITE